MKTYVLRKSPTEVSSAPTDRKFLIDYKQELTPAQYAAATSVNTLLRLVRKSLSSTVNTATCSSQNLSTC